MTENSNNVTEHSRPTLALRRLAGLFALLLTSTLCSADDTRIALLMPSPLTNSLNKVDALYNGILAVPGASIVRLDLQASTTEKQVNEWLQQQQADAVIAIGKSAYAFARNAGLTAPLIAGGLGRTPVDASSVSPSGAPDEFFGQIRDLTPAIRRVYLVYNEAINGWWIDSARLSASLHGLELVTLEAGSLRTGAKLYRKIVREAMPSRDAIWIPLVSIVPTKTVLPMILRKAWDKQLVVFSNRPADVKHGVLFSLYSDHTAIGSQMMTLAMEQAEAGDPRPRVLLAREMKRAFNWRTATHLGLDYSLQADDGFDNLYPSR